MSSGFGIADWGVLVAYFLVIGVSSVIFSRIKIATSRDYFVASNSVPMFAAAISILATTQSAATFLGGPEYSYLHDLTFIGFFISAFLAVIFVAWVL
ncbi:MAG: sodium:solute symporter, partial [Sulfurovaceae bacterium]